MRENDMVAIMLFNPEVSLFDLDASGINSNNTGIKEEKEYLKLKDIQENSKFRDNDGNFSEAKFHEFYTNALKNYNTLATGWQPAFHENNIFAPVSLRKTLPEFVETTIENPFRRTSSFKDIGEWGPQTKSVRELAEGQQVYNTETGEWMDSPETSFFGTIGMGPLVLATWDYNADKDGNPTEDPNKIVHKKGEYKLNDKGTFYYETLGGRSSVGKEILHYSDIITKEDSSWNKIDFLDSDDLEKSVMGTVAKNVALIGSMFLPGGVGYAVTAATLLQQSLRLGATLGKMLLGSNSYAMNNFQAFMGATDLHESKSDYAMNKVWSWENLINTAGDAIGQLRQQRVLFETVPWALGYGKLGKGKGIFSAEGQEALKDELIKKHSLILLSQNRNRPTNLLDFLTENKLLQLTAQARAIKEANDLTKRLTTLSGAVSKAYMTGITVNDMFDEAKEAGMGDFGAIAMTLGYAAAEYALLSTGIGELILPELRANKAMTRLLLGKVSKKTKDNLNMLETTVSTPKEKENFFWKAFNIGKKLYQDNRAGLGGAMLNASVGAVGEGVEEVTEEFLADAFRAMADFAHWTDTDMLRTDDILDRYGMNFVGGLIGGGVNGLNTDFSAFKRINNMTSEEAMKELIYKINNGDLKEIMSTIDKNKWGDQNLSTRIVQSDTGDYVWAQAENYEDSLDFAIKKMLKNQINSIVNVIEANGARITNLRYFDINTLKEARFAMLSNTSTAARYSEEYANRVLELVKIVNRQKELDASLTDEQKRDEDSTEYQTYLRQKEELEKRRKELAKEFEEIKKGSQAARFIGTALLEIHPAISQALMLGPTLDLFSLRTKGKSIRELTDEERAEVIKEYKEYKATQGKDDIIAAYDTWERIMEAVLNNFASRVEEYRNELDKYSRFIDLLVSTTDPSNPASFLLDAKIVGGYIDMSEAIQLEKELFGTTELKDILTKIDEDSKANIESRKKLHDDIVLKLDSGQYDEILDPNFDGGLDSNQKTDISNIKAILQIVDSKDERISNMEETLRNAYEVRKQSEVGSGTITEEEFDNKYKSELEEEIKSKKEEIEKDSKIGENKLKELKDNLKKQLETRLHNETVILTDMHTSLHMSERLSYFIRNFDKLLDSIALTGYLNPITKQKLQRVLELISGKQGLIEMYQNYLLDRPYIIGGEPSGVLTDPFVYATLHPQEIDDESDPHLFKSSPNVADLLGKMDTFGLKVDGKLLSDYLLEIRNNGSEVEVTGGKLLELSKRILETLKISDSPVLQLLDAFALDVTGTLINFSGILAAILAEINGSTEIQNEFKVLNPERISLDDIISNIELASKLIDLLYSVLMGARSDSAGFELNQLLSTDIPNFGIHFGINSIINEVKKKMGDDSAPFLTIEGELTDNIVKDLHLLSKTLKFYKDLYGINSGQKLKSQPKITLRANLLIYKALKKLYDVAPEDIDKSMLDDFFAEGTSNVITDNLNATLVSDDVLNEIEEFRIKIEDALYDFYDKNKDKQLLNIKEIASIFKKDSIILNETTEELSISSLLGYLASRMSLKSSDFYNEYRKHISPELAPLTLQELEAYVHMANVLNGNTFTQIKNKFRTEILSYLENLEEDERIKLFASQGMDLEEATFWGLDIMKPYLKLLPFVPFYDNISFVEGIAGSGKTRGVLKIVTEMLKSVSPDVLKDALIAHTSEPNAKKLASNLGLDSATCKSKKLLLEFISNWEEPSKNPDGTYKYVENKDHKIEDGQVLPVYKLKNPPKKPSIIIIDEIGRYTDLELATIDSFAKANGISVLVFGDLDQNVSEGNVIFKIPGLHKAISDKMKLVVSDKEVPSLRIVNTKDEVSLNMVMSRGLTMHGFKLGFSMRTRSSLLDKNQLLMQAKLQNPQGDIVFHYYEGADPDSGEFVLNGVKVYNYDTNSLLEQREKEILELVDKLVKTLKKDPDTKEQEKIGIIYQSEDSRLYKALKDKYGKDIIVGYLGKSAQGDEAKYFIMETDWDNKSDDSIVREINTGITRAQNGIILLTKHPNHPSGVIHIQNADMDISTKSMKLLPEEIQQVSDRRKRGLDQIYSTEEFNPQPLEYKPRTQIISPSSIPMFNIESTEVIGSRLIINITPMKIDNVGWITGWDGGSVTVKQFSCDLDGYNSEILFEDSESNEKRLPLDGIITNYVNVEIVGQESDVTVDETLEVNGDDETEGQVLNPDEVEENVDFTDEARKKHSETIKNRAPEEKLRLSLYTVSGMETGGYSKDEKTGRAVPISDKINPNRVDSMNGLMKIFGEDTSYDDMLDILCELLAGIHTLNRENLEEYIKNVLQSKLSGKTISKINLQFGLWTSTNKGILDHSESNSIWDRTKEERALFDDIPDANISRHNLSLLVKFVDSSGQFNSLLIPIGFLSSPFTLALNYPKDSPIRKMMEGRPADNALVEDILNSTEIYLAHPELYNLFKLFHFDNAGFFPLTQDETGIKLGWNNGKKDNFSLTSMQNRGVLIMRNRGMRQINGQYQLHTKINKDFVEIKEWEKDKRLKHSSKAYMFTLTENKDKESNPTIERKDSEGRTYQHPILKGRPFILVSSSTDDKTDLQLMNAWIDGDPSVRLVYLLPPLITFTQFMEDINRKENNDIDWFSGNDALAFKILNTLRKSRLKDLFDERKSNIGVSNVKKLIELLDRLEEAYNNARSNPKKVVIDGKETTWLYHDYSEFINILKSSDGGFFGDNANKYKLRKALRLITSDKVYDVNEDEENSKQHWSPNAQVIQEIQEVLEESDFLIYDNVSVGKKEGGNLIDGLVTEITSDTASPFTIHSGRPLLMDARVTTPTFFSDDLNVFIDSVVNYYIKNSKTRKNTTSNNDTVLLSLYKGFISDRVLRKTSSEPSTYKRSDKCKDASDLLEAHKDILLSEGKTIPTAPTKKEQEEDYINAVVELINNSKGIKKVILKYKSKLKVVDYSECQCLNKLEGEKHFEETTEDNKYNLTIGNIKFGVTKVGTRKLELLFEEIIGESLEEVVLDGIILDNTLLKDILGIENDNDFIQNCKMLEIFFKIDDVTGNPDYDNPTFGNEKLTKDQILNLTVKEYFERLVRYIANYTNNEPGFDDEYALMDIKTELIIPHSQKFVTYLKLHYPPIATCKDGRLLQSIIFGVRDDTILKNRTESTNEENEYSKGKPCNKFSIVI